MLLPAATILAGLLLLLPQPTTQLCKSATEDVCKQAKPAPGSTLAGEGFDITTMQRKGAFVIDMNTWETPSKTCTLCENLYQGGQMQIIPTSVSSFSSLQNCSMSIKSQLLESVMAVADHASKSVDNDWKVGLGLSTAGYGGSVALSGTNSRLANIAIAVENSKVDRFHFVSHSVQCGFYSYRISNNANLDPDFQQAFGKLPQIYNPSSKAEYDAFLDTYGTHFINTVQTGGKVESMTSIRECKASIMGLSSDEVKMCLGAEIAGNLPYKVDVDLSAQINLCNSKRRDVLGYRSFSNVFSDRATEISGGRTTEGELLFSADRASAYKKWLTSLPSNPDVITYTLKSLHDLIPDKTKKAEVKRAIRDYILSRGWRRQCSDQCKVGRRSRTNPESCVCYCHDHKSLGRNCCPTRPGYADVVLTIIRGQGLYGDVNSGTDGYVKVFDENNQLLDKTRTIDNDDNPHWNKEFYLSDMLLSEKSALVIEVWDEDNNSEELLGTCNVNLRSGYLREKVCLLKDGKILYNLKVTCAPSLSGPTCSEYVTSPMISQLKNLFVSHHAVPIRKHMFPERKVTKQPVDSELTTKQKVENELTTQQMVERELTVKLEVENEITTTQQTVERELTVKLEVESKITTERKMEIKRITNLCLQML